MRRTAAALAVLALLATAARARANEDEFATFDVLAQEADIKNFLDYYLARTPDAWRAEWDDSTGGVRVDQGCMTAGIWYQSNELKSRAPLGPRAWMDAGFLQHADPQASWQWVRLDFWRDLGRFGAVGGRFQPAYEKSQHDFAALWQSGRPGDPLLVRATFTVVDAFNNLWEFRQSQVGTHWEPYRAHPFQPELLVRARGPRHRVEFEGKWLTPSRREIHDAVPENAGVATLWGSRFRAVAERDAGAWTGILRGEGTQALSTHASPAVPGDGRSYRRAWIAEAGVRRTLSPRLAAEARYLYGSRAQDWRPPLASAAFRALDRMGTAEVDWRARPEWLVRMGLLYDRVGVTEDGSVPGFSWLSRKKSRAFVGLQARFGRVRVQGIEGIDLDREPYPVSFRHDKGFLHLQTTF